MLISSWCDLKPSKQLFNCENWFGSHIALRHMWSNLQKRSKDFNQTKNKFCWSNFVTTWNILRDESHQFFCLVIFHWLFLLTLTIYFASESWEIYIRNLIRFCCEWIRIIYEYEIILFKFWYSPGLRMYIISTKNR